MTMLDDLQQRMVDDGADRQRWLEARQGRVTASMIGKMYLGGPGERRKILEDSFIPPVEITGNKYIDRGHEREPIIHAWISQHWPAIQPNVALFHAKDETRFAATPDGIGERNGRLVLAEIKTSKNDVTPTGQWFHRTGYYEQMQWQMYVCDASATLFVVEQHDNDWEEGPTPLYPEPKWSWVQRDDELIERLHQLAELALAERDFMAQTQGFDEAVDGEVARLTTEILELRQAKQSAEARLKTPWVALQEYLADREEFSERAGRGMVTWSNREVMETVPDVEAALAAKVEGVVFEDVTGAELKRQADRAQEMWQTHLARFTKQVPKRIQKLTVTEPKVKPLPDQEDYGEF